MATLYDNPPCAPRAALQELAAFVRRPRVLDPEGLRSRGAWATLATMTVLQIAGLLLIVMPLIAAWQKLFALPAPDAFGKLPGGWLLPVTVIAAPVLEEIAFRSWQSGRPRALWAAAAVGLAVATTILIGSAASPFAKPLVLLAGIVVAAGGWLALRRRETGTRFRAAFPAIFYLTALAFAAIHLMNYRSISVQSLPMVLPQLWAGVLLGFTRQRLGLPAAMLQHAAANAAMLGIAVAAG